MGDNLRSVGAAARQVCCAAAARSCQPGTGRHPSGFGALSLLGLVGLAKPLILSQYGLFIAINAAGLYEWTACWALFYLLASHSDGQRAGLARPIAQSLVECPVPIET